MQYTSDFSVSSYATIVLFIILAEMFYLASLLFAIILCMPRTFLLSQENRKERKNEKRLSGDSRIPSGTPNTVPSTTKNKRSSRRIRGEEDMAGSYEMEEKPRVVVERRKRRQERREKREEKAEGVSRIYPCAQTAAIYTAWSTLS